MPTKAAAFHAFLEAASGLTAYAASAVPDDAQMPYATYAWAEGAWGDGDVSVQVDLWFRTESEAVPNAAVAELGKALGLSGAQLQCDGGGMWVKRGSPWAQAVADGDNAASRRYVNIDIEFFTDY